MGQQGDYGQYGQQQDPRRVPPPARQPDPWAASAPQGGYGQPGWQQQGYQPPPQPPYQQPPYPPSYGPPSPQPPRKSRKGLAFLGCGGLGALVILIAALASHGTTSSAPPATLPTLPSASLQGAAPASTAAASKQTVTYVVTGSPADVTYGPAGTELSGSVPMQVTKAVPSHAPVYYAISAQLQGGGTVSCEIKVDGKVISQSTASGSYQIASCEISQDPFSGAWQDTNAAG